MPRAARLGPVVLVIAVSGCATGRTRVDDPGPLAVQWRLPSEIIDGFTGSLLESDQVWDNLSRARVVYVAERHDAPADHAVQMAVLAAMHQRVGSVGLGMEMFRRSHQPILDAYVAGAIDEAQLREQTDWEHTWGFEFGLYRPMLQYARQHRIPVYGLNVESEISRAIARNGLDGLSEADRALIPPLDLSRSDHRDYVRRAMGFSEDSITHEAHGGLSFDNLYQAQVLWDEYMAQSIAQALDRPEGPEHLVVLAGAGHVEYRFGIPERAALRGAEPYRTVLPVRDVDLSELRALVEASAGDFLWVMARKEDHLPFLSARPWGIP